MEKRESFIKGFMSGVTAISLVLVSKCNEIPATDRHTIVISIVAFMLGAKVILTIFKIVQKKFEVATLRALELYKTTGKTLEKAVISGFMDYGMKLTDRGIRYYSYKVIDLDKCRTESRQD